MYMFITIIITIVFIVVKVTQGLTLFTSFLYHLKDFNESLAVGRNDDITVMTLSAVDC
jgi:hypothetical protein